MSLLRALTRYVRPVVFSVLCAAAFSSMPVAARGWEFARTEPMPEAKVVARQSDIEVRATRGMIVVTTNHPVQIKVYSILGQLVAQGSMQGGTYRMNVAAHGVYIVKIGDLTCKVAV